MLNLKSRPREDHSHDPARLIAKAAFNAARELGLSQRELGAVIGVSEATVSRMKDGGHALADKPYELATCLIRVYRSLDAITAGDPDSLQGWMRNPNTDLAGVPAALIQQATGLVAVMNYLDAARAPL